VKAIHNAIKAEGTLKALNANLQKSESATYQATYVTTGSAPATVVVAQQPPHNYSVDVAQSGNRGAFQYIANSTGFYACTEGTAGSTGSSGATGSTSTSAAGAAPGWSCFKFGAGQSGQYNAVGELYTPQYWYPVLEAAATVGALAGLDVKSSTMSVNGINLQCTSLTAKSGNSGSNSTQTGTWCVTSQGILGYVAASGDSTAFEIKSYSTTPAASLFQVPAGAKVTSVAGSSGASGSTGSGGATSST
jgi:hypothetical protein